MASIEVELKFVAPRDLSRLVRLLQDLGAEFLERVEQHDTYYAHPSRHFSETDEALRVRRIGDQNLITYKGALLDRQSKSRHEIEIPFQAGATMAEQMDEMWELLGFRRVLEVSKERQRWLLHWEEQEIEVALDAVHDLGHYVEIEILSDASGWISARDSMGRLAQRLELQQGERRSYLQLLLENGE